MARPRPVRVGVSDSHHSPPHSEPFSLTHTSLWPQSPRFHRPLFPERWQSQRRCATFCFEQCWPRHTHTLALTVCRIDHRCLLETTAIFGALVPSQATIASITQHSKRPFLFSVTKDEVERTDHSGALSLTYSSTFGSGALPFYDDWSCPHSPNGLRRPRQILESSFTLLTAHHLVFSRIAHMSPPLALELDPEHLTGR